MVGIIPVDTDTLEQPANVMRVSLLTRPIPPHPLIASQALGFAASGSGLKSSQSKSARLLQRLFDTGG